MNQKFTLKGTGEKVIIYSPFKQTNHKMTPCSLSSPFENILFIFLFLSQKNFTKLKIKLLWTKKHHPTSHRHGGEKIMTEF